MLRKWIDHDASQWLSTPLGESLLTEEARIVEEALEVGFHEARVGTGRHVAGEGHALILLVHGQDGPDHRIAATDRAASDAERKEQTAREEARPHHPPHADAVSQPTAEVRASHRARAVDRQQTSRATSAEALLRRQVQDQKGEDHRSGPVDEGHRRERPHRPRKTAERGPIGVGHDSQHDARSLPRDRDAAVR